MARAFAGVVNSIYESAADGSWAGVMGDIAARFGAHAGLIYSCDKSSRKLFQDSVDQIGFDPAMLDEYSRYYIHRNVWSQNERLMPEGKAVASSALYPDSELKKTEYYSEWLSRQDIFYGLGGLVSNVDRVVTKMTFVRSERRGAFTGDEIRQMGRLMPHFRAASQIRSRMQRCREMAANAIAAFDLMPFGTILVNRHAAVMHMSNKAVPFTGKSGPLALDAHGRLAASSPEVTASLHQAIGDAALLRQGHSGAATAPIVLVAAGGQTVTVTVAPLGVSANVHTQQGPWLAVFLDIAQPPQGESLRERFGLTAAEAELATMLAAGARPKEVAAHRGVSINTVRTQLASCMHKLNVNRQADLVRVVAQSQADARPRIIYLSDARGGG